MSPIGKTFLFRWNKQSLMRTMRKMKRRKKELETISELVTGAEQSGVRMLWFTRFSIDTNSKRDVLIYRLCSCFNIVQRGVKPMLEKYRFCKGILT